MPTPVSLLDRFRGCMLGQAVGDALGAPFETMPGSAIYYGFGSARKILASPPVDVLEYTDDTQMMIGVAETLVERGHIDQDFLMQAFVANFDARRAYGAGAHQLIEHAACGNDWRKLADSIFAGGSFGNGAAMRVAPIGLLFHGDLDRVEHQATLSAVVTHTHPIGIDSARLFAVAVALSLHGGTFSSEAFFGELQKRAATDEFCMALEQASNLTGDSYVGALGVSVEAHRSVPTALACFASSPASYEDAVGRAIGLGGDVDTIAAMTGALSGARLGISAIPAHLINLLEDGAKGQSYIDRLATRLHDAKPR
jgi:poly(ADP-ribose) glycohydrolase ARH3